MWITPEKKSHLVWPSLLCLFISQAEQDSSLELKSSSPGDGVQVCRIVGFVPRAFEKPWLDNIRGGVGQCLFRDVGSRMVR